jgi:8-oxo-dGTP diphosphatase
VAAGVLVRGGRVLLGRRRADARWYADAWDVVGGHLEDRETPFEALVRECREELGIEVTAADEALVVDLDDIRLWVFVVRSWRGEPVNAAPEEHELIGWFDVDELPTAELADARLATVIRSVVTGTPQRGCHGPPSDGVSSL